MGTQERRAHLDAIRTRYRRARKADKTAILNEFCAVCSYHRKYALRLLRPSGKRDTSSVRKPGPASRYAVPELVLALRTIWMASDQPCSKRLKAALPLWLPHYEIGFKPLSVETRALLDAISAASIDRLLKPRRATLGKKGLVRHPAGDAAEETHSHPDRRLGCHPVRLHRGRHGGALRRQPGWEFRVEPDHDRSVHRLDGVPGHLEQGFSWRNGANQGDPASFAVPGLGIRLRQRLRIPQLASAAAFPECRTARHIHALTSLSLKRQCACRAKELVVRAAVVRLQRLADPRMVVLMNDLYADPFSLLTNFFHPTLKLASKARDGSQRVRKHGKPATPRTAADRPS